MWPTSGEVRCNGVCTSSNAGGRWEAVDNQAAVAHLFASGQGVVCGLDEARTNVSCRGLNTAGQGGVMQGRPICDKVPTHIGFQSSPGMRRSLYYLLFGDRHYLQIVHTLPLFMIAATFVVQKQVMLHPASPMMGSIAGGVPIETTLGTLVTREPRSGLAVAARALITPR